MTDGVDYTWQQATQLAGKTRPAHRLRIRHRPRHRDALFARPAPWSTAATSTRPPAKRPWPRSATPAARPSSCPLDLTKRRVHRCVRRHAS